MSHIKSVLGLSTCFIGLSFIGLCSIGCSSRFKTSDVRRDLAGVEAGSNSFELPQYQEKTLPNGLRILFVPDEKLPYVTFSLLVRAGSAQDPASHPGLTAMVAELLDKGTVKRSATQIANDLGNMGAELDSSASFDYTTVTASGLSSPIAVAMA